MMNENASHLFICQKLQLCHWLNYFLTFVRCTDGYVGSRCQFRDPCTTSPCMNGGTCRAVTKGNTVDFSCTCKLGFTDRRCLTPIINACSSSPCLNGGTCEWESLQTYRCRCTPGWSGNVQYDYDRKRKLLTWSSMQKKSCQSLIFWTERSATEPKLEHRFFVSSGKLCQQADPCASNPCANGGHCSAIESHYVCTCTPFFSGQTCKQDVNECDASPSPCKNDGVCINDVGGYRCKCPAEYVGKHCESRYLPCNPSPCHNGGTCIQKGETSYECSCVPGTV